jgi:hypothetical protein
MSDRGVAGGGLNLYLPEVGGWKLALCEFCGPKELAAGGKRG